MAKKKVIWKFQLSLREKIGHEISQTKWLRDSLDKYFDHLLSLLEKFSGQIAGLSETNQDRERGRNFYYAFLNKRLALIEGLKKSLDQKGQIVILFACLLLIIIPLLLGGLDMGMILISRNEAQNGADAACLAGGRVIGSQYEALKCEDRNNFICSESEVISVVKDLLSKNRCELGTVKIGVWDYGSKTINLTDFNSDCVQVTAVRKVSLSIIPRSEVKAVATSALLRDHDGLIGPCGAEGNWMIPKITQ